MQARKNFPVGKTIGERLRWIRKKDSRTLQEFGALIGFDQSYLSRLERNKATNPSAEFLRRVSTLCQVNAEWLEHGVGEPMPTQEEGTETYSPVGAQLEEDTNFTAVLNILMEELQWEQILRCLQRIIAHPAISEKAKVVWVKTLGKWATVKMELDGKRAAVPNEKRPGNRAS